MKTAKNSGHLRQADRRLGKFYNSMNRSGFINLLEIAVLLLLPIFSRWLNILYVLLAILLVLISRYLRKERWTEYGFRPVRVRTLWISAGIGIAFGLADNYVLEPLVNRISGHAPDLSTFDNIKGNAVDTLVLLALAWIVGGFFEESYFRGYTLNRINLTLNNRTYARWTGAIMTSLAFALAHSYQGVGGIVVTFYFSIIMSILYYSLSGNVWYAILIHGFYDTVGIIYLYLGK